MSKYADKRIHGAACSTPGCDGLGIRLKLGQGRPYWVCQTCFDHPSRTG